MQCLHRGDNNRHSVATPTKVTACVCVSTLGGMGTGRARVCVVSFRGWNSGVRSQASHSAQRPSLMAPSDLVSSQPDALPFGFRRTSYYL